MEANLINSNINTQNNDIITLEPNKIFLFKLSDQMSIKINEQHLHEGRMILKNNTNNHLVFKFSNSQKNSTAIYSITPTIYYINPKGTININIKRFDKVNKFF